MSQDSSPPSSASGPPLGSVGGTEPADQSVARTEQSGSPTLPDAVHVDPHTGLRSDQVHDLATAAAVFDCQLIHIGRSGSALQLVIDHADGVNVDHCANVSRQASAVLDRDDYGTRRYVLEVTSPGIERDLYQPSDFARFAGEQAKVTYRTPAGDRRTVRVGIVRAEEVPGATGSSIIHLLESDRKEIIKVSHDAIERARLVVEL